mmetsp:Transcript_35719/g.60867  ORF Transcript_35719/g.60867 Transcript_35719/m.60867 type:complete len:96 (-) Transcript_35719:1081-1368(-)
MEKLEETEAAKQTCANLMYKMCFRSYVKGWNKTMQPRMGIGNNINETEKRGCFFIQCSSPALSGLGLSLAPLMFQPRHQNVIAEVTFLSSTIILQ